MFMYNGLKVYASNTMTKQITTPIVKSCFELVIDAIQRWNPCNEYSPDFKVINEQSNEIVRIGDCLFAHPVVVKKIRDTLKENNQLNSFEKLLDL